MCVLLVCKSYFRFLNGSCIINSTRGCWLHQLEDLASLGEKRSYPKALLNAPYFQRKPEVVSVLVTVVIFKVKMHLVQRSKKCVVPQELKLLECKIQHRE